MGLEKRRKSTDRGGDKKEEERWEEKKVGWRGRSSEDVEIERNNYI